MVKVSAVLDTSALLSYIKGEPGSESIANIIDQSIMSMINLTEAIIVLSRIKPDQLEYYQMAVNELVEHKYQSDYDLMIVASEIAVKYRHEHNLSLGDAYCLSLAKVLQLPVYTGDKAWDGLQEKLKIDIKFIR